MTTIAQVAKQVVADSIDMEYLEESGCTTLRQVYDKEYGYNGIHPKTCASYLQGLPSVCTVPFENYKILALLVKELPITLEFSDEYTLIEKYWKECGNAFYQMIKG